MNRLPTLREILSDPCMVSSHSRFDADVWYLDGSTPGQTEVQFAIHWGVAADQRLINGLKYLAALLFLERDGRRIYKHTTAPTFSAGARHLLRFMQRHSYSCFSEIDEAGVKHYQRHLHVALSDPELAAEDQEEPESTVVEDEIENRPMTPGKRQAKSKKRVVKEIDTDEFSYAAAYNRLRPLQNLWDYRDELEGAGIRSLPSEPFAESSVVDEAKDAAAVAVKLIPPLPEEVAVGIMSDALQMIGTPADDVIELQRLCLNQMARLDRQPPTPERARIRRTMEAFQFGRVGAAPWHEPIKLPPEQAGGADKLRAMIELIRAACITVIFSSTGCRISEVLSLGTSGAAQPLPLFARRQPEPALPSCVSVTKSKSGLHQHYFMHGKLTKNESEPKDEKWLIGSHPMDRSDMEPPALRAIRVLERLYAPWRELITDERTRKQLILNFMGRGLPRSGGSIKPATSGQVRHALSNYLGRPQIGWDDMDSSNAKLRPYIISRGRCIRPHQWRKTFALFMMRLDERLLPALAHHFKHLSLAVTEGAYMPSDPSMIAAGQSVHMMETHRVLYEMRSGAGSKFGKLDRAMDAFRADLEKILGDLPLEESYEQFERVILEHDLRIYNAEHGRCLIAANPDKARCHTAGGTSGWRRLHPNYATRTPGMCAGCDNFSIGREHVGFWKRRYLQNQSAWLAANRSGDFEIVRRRAEQAAAVLKAMGEPVPTTSSAAAPARIGIVPVAATQPHLGSGRQDQSKGRGDADVSSAS